MGRPSRPSSPARLQVAAGFALILVVACSPANRAAHPATATASFRGAPTSSPGDEWVERDIALERTVSRIAKPGLWPLEVDAAESLLTELAPVRREELEEDQLMLVGGLSRGLDHFEVSYSRDEDTRWAFDSADFFFADTDMAHLYQTLESLVVQQLGAPDWTARSEGAEFSSARWSFGSVMRLLFSPALDGGEPALSIAISGPDGND
jgi:hypothetical protein